MIALPAPVGRAIALALLLAVAAAGYAVLIAPERGLYTDANDRITVLSDALERYRRAGANLDALARELAEARRQHESQHLFLSGANDTLIGADIQNRVNALVAEGRGELRSAQLLPAQTENGMRRITLRAQATLTVGAAQRVFHEVESAEPLLFLDNVDIRVREGTRRHGEPIPEGQLDVRFDVYGYVEASP